MRPGKRGLTEDRQKKLAQKAARKIMQKVRVAQRGELRKLQRSREIELREMKHKLREEGG